jgi:hypothetical protein
VPKSEARLTPSTETNAHRPIPLALIKMKILNKKQQQLMGNKNQIKLQLKNFHIHPIRTILVVHRFPSFQLKRRSLFHPDSGEPQQMQIQFRHQTRLKAGSAPERSAIRLGEKPARGIPRLPSFAEVSQNEMI